MEMPAQGKFRKPPKISSLGEHFQKQLFCVICQLFRQNQAGIPFSTNSSRMVVTICDYGRSIGHIRPAEKPPST